LNFLTVNIKHMRELLILIKAMIGTAFIGGASLIAFNYFGWIACFVVFFIAVYLFFEALDYLGL
jgi:hypothetical protein